MTSDVIIGFLTGSLLTEVVRESIRLFTKGIEHKKELAKLTYERKLQMAEDAMAYYYTYYERLIEMKTSYEIYVKRLEEYEIEDAEMIQNLIQHNSKLLSELSNDKYFDINAVFLYFNLDHDNHWGEQDAGLLTEAKMKATLLEDQIKYWFDLFYKPSKSSGDQHYNYWINATELFEPLSEALQNVITLLYKNQESMRRIVNLIKEQTIKY
jgi:hypothetical protein